MADALISVVLDQLVSIIQREAQQEVRLVVGVEEEVEKLTSNLQAIQAVLNDAEKRQVKEATVKQWLDKLKDVSYDMDDLLDEWNTAILKRQIEGVESASEPKRKVEGVESAFFLPSCCFCFTQVALRRDIAVKIKDLNKRLDVIAIEKDRYNFDKGIEEPKRQITASVIDVSKVYGRDEHKDAIVNMLSESSQGQDLRIISIVGMGGIGKTTLAQLVYNDDSVKAHFEIRIWVCVSDPFDEVRIAKAILEALTNQTPNLVELDSLLHNIHQSIEGKKLLLVLDDVWTEDSTKWEQLENSLKCGSRGSQILVTTRKENVANIMGATIFPLRQLSNDDCWSLFSQIAFFGRTLDERGNLEDIGRKIAEKCKGLPLAAKTLGSLLRFKKAREEWQRVLDNEIWELEEFEKKLFPPLLLSYYDLPFAMRQCFSYCAIFPKDYEIEKDELIKMWMAQGYLKATRIEDTEMIGEQYFDNLAMRSFFQDFEKSEDDGSIERCKMHDIVHDFAQFLTKNECFSVEVIGSEELRLNTSYEKTRHLMMGLAEEVSFPTSIYNMKTLRSLLVKSRDLSVIGVALPNVFEQLTCLRTLELSAPYYSSSLKEVPEEVGKLIHLRYLNLTYNIYLEKLPETVCDFCNLQTLNLSYCKNLQNLPKGIGKLINLRHLEIDGADKICFMPKGFVRLSSLRTLSNFIVAGGDDDSEASKLGDLKNFNHLRGFLVISGLGNVGDVGEATKAQIKNKKHLLRLWLKFNFNVEQVGAMINDEQVIEALQPPSNLKQLGIYEYRGTTLFLSWMMSLTKLRRVILVNCNYCECLPPLGKLSSLESLYIRRMKSVKKVGFEFLGLEADGHNNNNACPSMGDKGETSSSSSFIAFPKLKKLTFYDMKEWEEWDYGITSRVSTMPCLCSITISNCPKLKSLPDHLLQTTTLEKLLIRECPILAERYYNDKKGEDWPKISHIPYIEIDFKECPSDGSDSTENSSDGEEPGLISPS